MIKVKITLGKVLAALMIGLSVSGIISNITDNQQLASWQFNTLCWAIVAIMIELRLDKAEGEYNDLVDTIFTAYEEQKNAEEVKEDAE
jgi:uncharacterized membrane protein AbrB (regulator of aidB expression)